MTDSNEVGALKASLRGALSTADALAALHPRIEALDPHVGVSAELLEELARVAGAHANASHALRGFVAAMQTRRRDAGG